MGSKAESKAKKATASPAHPKYIEMITSALKSLKERNGSSRQAILRYIVASYMVSDEKKAAVRVKLALRKAVADGALRQMKGTGASGSFKLAKVEAKPAARSVDKELKTKSTVKKTGVKRDATKKPAAKTKKPINKKVSAKKTKGKKPTKKTTIKQPIAKKLTNKNSANASIAKKTEKSNSKTNKK